MKITVKSEIKCKWATNVPNITEEIKKVKAFLNMTQITCLESYMEVVEQTSFKTSIYPLSIMRKKQKHCKVLPNTQAKSK